MFAQQHTEQLLFLDPPTRIDLSPGSDGSLPVEIGLLLLQFLDFAIEYFLAGLLDELTNLSLGAGWAVSAA
ncbi:MAG: hypothetical protein ABSG53_14780 [Thermoguttaceae bacterium]